MRLKCYDKCFLKPHLQIVPVPENTSAFDLRVGKERNRK